MRVKIFKVLFLFGKNLSTINMGLFNLLKNITTKWWNSVKKVFSSSDNFDDLLSDLRIILLSGDVGVDTTDKLILKLKEFISSNSSITNEDIYNYLVKVVRDIVSSEFDKTRFLSNNFNIVVIFGVNGVGKTTSVAKIANMFKKNNMNVLVGAADTFRAAAVDQLKLLSDKIGVKLLNGDINDNPSTVVYKTLDYARNNGFNTIVIDTAGRLHNKQNLMNEFNKIDKVITKFIDSKTIVQRWMVIDGTMGQNVFRQIDEFSKIVNITGFIVTKTDSIAKSGFIIGLIDKYKVPIVYLGIGEGVDDLCEFDSNKFVDNLFNS